MTRQLSLAKCGCLVLAAIVISAASVSSAPPAVGDPEHPVEAEFLVDRRQAAPGGRVRAGVRLRVRPGWHVCWKKPGEAGLSTRVRIRTDDDVHVGRLRWPIPQRFEQPGSVIGCGYEESVLLFAPLTVPEDRPAGKLSITAEADWLAYSKDVCLPGSAKGTVKLPVGQETVEANRELFDKWTRRLPRRPEELADVLGVDIHSRSPGQAGQRAAEVALRWKGPTPKQIECSPWRGLSTSRGGCRRATSRRGSPSSSARGGREAGRDGRGRRYIHGRERAPPRNRRYVPAAKTPTTSSTTRPWADSAPKGEPQ